jgi:hypothetical protein
VEEHAKSRLNSLKITFTSTSQHDKEADELFKSILTPATTSYCAIDNTARVATEDTDESPEAIRVSLLSVFSTRLNHSEIFINEAQNARRHIMSMPWGCA